MQLRILHDSDAPLFRTFLKSFTHTPFLQSLEWREFQQAYGHHVVHLGVFDNPLGKEALVASALLIRHPLPGKWFYWYCPRGPVFHPSLSSQAQARAFSFLLSETPRVPECRGAVFFRCEPSSILPSSVGRFSIPRWVQPTHTHILDLSLSSAALLSAMKQKTRYNIRLAEKHHIEVRASRGIPDIRLFGDMLSEVNERHGIRAHPFRYYDIMLQFPSFARLYVASMRGQLLAGGIFIFSGDTVTYLHGGSFAEKKSFMAPYLLQWRVIQSAQQEGYRWYDFGGVAPPGQAHHQLSGVTRFKEGFGGAVKEFPYRYDVPFSPWRYALFSFGKKLRALFIQRLRS